MKSSTVITQDIVLATRKHFADLNQLCINDVISGETKVEDPNGYINWCNEMTCKSLAGEYDHTFTFIQHAHYLATGESVPLLP